MNEKDRQLTGILAYTDAIFRPIRPMDWHSPAPSNIYQARRDFCTGGVEISSGGSEASRKNRQRLLDALVGGGMATKSGTGKSALYRLTEMGDAFTRSACGLPSLAESRDYLIKIINGECETDYGPLTPEFVLLGETNYQQNDDFTVRIFDLETFLLPSLVACLLDARSDLHGRVYFSATELGREAARQPAPTPPDNLPRFEKSAADLYFQQRAEYRAQLRMAKPKTPSELGFCPLPASIALRPRIEVPADAQ